MAALGDTVYYYTPATPEQPSVAVPAAITGTRADGEILFLQGQFYLGYVVAQEADEPMPGRWIAAS